MYITHALPCTRTRQEVATMLFPTERIATAVARLRRWIDSDATLRGELERAGYQKGAHWFTPKIIRILKRYFL